MSIRGTNTETIGKGKEHIEEKRMKGGEKMRLSEHFELHPPNPESNRSHHINRNTSIEPPLPFSGLEGGPSVTLSFVANLDDDLENPVGPAWSSLSPSPCPS